MSRRRKRRRSDEGTAFRVVARVVRVALVVLVSVAVGYAFYFGLRWVAGEPERRGSGAALWASPAVSAGEDRWATSATI